MRSSGGLFPTSSDSRSCLGRGGFFMVDVEQGRASQITCSCGTSHGVLTKSEGAFIHTADSVAEESP